MKGQMKRIVAVMLSIMMVFTLVPLSSVNAASKAKLNKKSATIYVGKTVQLKVNNNKKKVKWSTSNKKIAIVNKKGKVTGKKAGKVTITAKIGKKKYNCKVTVKNKAVVEPTNVPETAKPAEQPATSIEQSTTKPAEQPTAKPAEQPTTKPEQPSTNPVEETTTDNYGDSGEDWIVKSTSNKCWIQEYVGNDTDIVIPSRICGKEVVGIEKDTFLNSKQLISVTLSDGLTSIGNYAFSGCTNLKSVAIPETLTDIGEYAFSGCTSLDNVIIPLSVNNIGNLAFENCTQLSKVEIRGDKNRFSYDIFRGCTKLYDLVWEDDFDSNTLDMNIWSFETGTGDNGWGNEELQNYTVGDNVKVENGNLVIIPRMEWKNGASAPSKVTSTRITTKNKKTFKYGKIEIRAKATGGKGTWSEGWMLGDGTGDSRGWPYDGEIDIMSAMSGGVSQTIHCERFNNQSWSHGNKNYATGLTQAKSAETYHTYGIIWTDKYIQFTVDGVNKGLYDPSMYDASIYDQCWAFDHPFFFILNCAVGGNAAGEVSTEGWTNKGTVNDVTTWEDYFYIDYIKQYKFSLNI